jgi:2-polyprenyl-6-methoxyphenol hydroxylase-like FAD-dependent oxidoreductase
MLKDTIRVNDHYTCDYLYGCDGLNGTVRDYLKIPLVGNRDVQRFLNIHFTSK